MNNFRRNIGKGKRTAVVRRLGAKRVFACGENHTRFDGTSEFNSKHNVSQSDIRYIAERYFADNASTKSIANAIGLEESYVLDILRGKTQTHRWSKAVTDLIAEGNSCDRRLAPTPKPTTRHDRRNLYPALVRSIRRRFADGDPLEDIVQATGVKTTRVRELIARKTYLGPEYFDKGEE